MAPPLSSYDTTDLVARMRTGDAAAFRRLFEEWFQSLATLAYHYTGSLDAADDVVQDAFVTFWNDRTQWQWTGDAYGYLQLLVRRKAIDQLRRAGTEARHHAASHDEGRSPASGAPIPAADVELMRRELWAAVSAAVRRLPPRVRAVAILRWFEGVGRAEAADALGVSVRTVDAQLVTAVKSVRDWLTRHGYDRE